MSTNPQELEAMVLDAARNNDERSLNEAIQKLVDEVLVPAAKMAAGSKQRRVDLQPESVVQSVIAKELPKAISECADESHLRARLVLAVKHKVIDRLRVGGKHGQPMQFGQQGTECFFDPSEHAPGPASQAASIERIASDDKALEHFSNAILALAKNDADRALLQCFILDGVSWAAAAKSAGLTETAARQRVSRLRGGALAKLFEPLRARFDGETWAIAEGVLINRIKPVTLAKTLGVSESHVEDACDLHVFPALAAIYGGKSIEPILRLLGNKRAPRS